MRKLGIGTLTLGVLLTMAGLRVTDLLWARSKLIEAAEARAANLALVVAAYLHEAFAAGDASLRQLALHSRRVGGPAAPASSWSPSLASAKAGLTSIGAISVVDANGIIRHSTRTEIVGHSRRKETLFVRASQGSGDELLVGTPFSSLATPPQPLIPIARRLTNDEGRWQGIVVASFIPTVPRRFFQSVDVGQSGSLWVFHPDGVVLYHEPSPSSGIGEPAGDNPIFRAAARVGGSGTLRTDGEPGGSVRLNAFHVESDPPLITAVSLDQAEVLADWKREAAASAVLFVVATATVIGTLVVLFRQMDAKVALERSALAREQAARRQAESDSELKDEFLMMVSHELRTPLTAIYGWTRMLVAGAVGDAQREHALHTIERNARIQMRLIDDLLDGSASAGGKLRLDMRMVDISRVVDDAVGTVTAAAEAKGIRIVTDFDPAAGRVKGDTDRLQQIVWNLLSNAVKFTPAGGRVDVTVRRAGASIEVAVADTGAGISPGFLPHVFERFRQQEGGTNRRYGGLGLGLAIARNLAELHGGTITVQSAGANRGATFVLRLPAPASPADEHAPRSAEIDRLDSAPA